MQSMDQSLNILCRNSKVADSLCHSPRSRLASGADVVTDFMSIEVIVRGGEGHKRASLHLFRVRMNLTDIRAQNSISIGNQNNI